LPGIDLSGARFEGFWLSFVVFPRDNLPGEFQKVLGRAKRKSRRTRDRYQSKWEVFDCCEILWFFLVLLCAWGDFVIGFINEDF
jgi:hypothetical protein